MPCHGFRDQKKAATGFKRKLSMDKLVTEDILTIGDKTTVGVNQKNTKSSQQEWTKTLSNAYSDYTDFPLLVKALDPDTEFGSRRKVWRTSGNPHTRKVRESQERLLGPLLSFEPA